MTLKTRAMIGLLIVPLVLVGYGFRSSRGPLNQAPQTPVVKKFTAADLAKLKWIEGTWRGTGDIEKPFFERYRFEDASTLLVDSFPDDKVTVVENTTRFELKAGQFGNGGDGGLWAASLIDDQGITFEPIAKAKNSFRWQRDLNGSWIAILKWPAGDGKPARQRIYKMERWPAPGQVRPQ